MYLVLENKEWLLNEYEAKHLTIEKIASNIKSNFGAVRKALIFHDIKIRDSRYSQRLSKGFPVELENKEWLSVKYVEEKLSLSKIGKILNTNHCNVRSALVRHEIPLRTHSQGQKTRYEQDGCNDYFIFKKNVIEGCLLGDGGLVKSNKNNENSFAVFRKKNIGYDHILHVANLIFSEQADKRISQTQYDDDKFVFSKYKPKTTFRFATLAHKKLNDLYLDWYPESNDFKKLIPDSLKIDETVLLHWFMDDGYSYWANAKGKYKYLRIQFATQCFTKDSIDKLSSKIKDSLGLKINPRYHQRHGKIKGYGYFMELSQSQNHDFFDLIGPCPVPSMAYKWKLT